jgi:hypothetical protein
MVQRSAQGTAGNEGSSVRILQRSAHDSCSGGRALGFARNDGGAVRMVQRSAHGDLACEPEGPDIGRWFDGAASFRIFRIRVGWVHVEHTA